MTFDEVSKLSEKSGYGPLAPLSVSGINGVLQTESLRTKELRQADALTHESALIFFSVDCTTCEVHGNPIVISSESIERLNKSEVSVVNPSHPQMPQAPPTLPRYKFSFGIKGFNLGEKFSTTQGCERLISSGYKHEAYLCKTTTTVLEAPYNVEIVAIDGIVNIVKLFLGISDGGHNLRDKPWFNDLITNRNISDFQKYQKSLISRMESEFGKPTIAILNPSNSFTSLLEKELRNRIPNCSNQPHGLSQICNFANTVPNFYANALLNNVKQKCGDCIRTITSFRWQKNGIVAEVGIATPQMKMAPGAAYNIVIDYRYAGVTEEIIETEKKYTQTQLEQQRLQKQQEEQQRDIKRNKDF